MQVNQNSDLVTYSLEEAEVVVGNTLNYLQKAAIQNQRVAISQELINLKPDDMTTAGKETYWQREAYLRGQLDILTHLLQLSESYEQQELAQQSS